jgi:hypothetical protein
MNNRIKDTFFLAFFLIFVFLITKYYLSERNKIFTNKSRSSYSLELKTDISKLPVLKNDTKNIILYKNDIDEFKKNRKKRFWENLISNTNE